MARIAHITAFALLLLLIGLVTPHSRATTPEYTQRTPGFQAAQPGDALPDDGRGQVVSQRRAKSDDKKTKPTRTRTEPASKSDGPMGVFSDVEKGWNTKDVNLILKHFGRGKATISIDGTGPSGGQFSKNQSYYLLKDLFKYTITRKFEFVQYRKPNKKGKRTFAVAERHYQKTDDGRLFKDKIYVSLHLESSPEEKPVNERWVVDEIKSIR